MYKVISEKIIDETGLADVFQVDTLTFPAKAGVTTGDYINVYAQDGTAYALFLDLTGADSNPTGANFVAADYSGSADISSATDAASVAAIVEIALNALTDFTATITSDDSAADGTMTLTQVTKGVTTSPVPNNEDDSGAGSITTSPTTTGYAQPDVESNIYNIEYLYGYSASIKWVSSTCSASLKMQESNDRENWVDVSGGTQAILNNSGLVLINLADRMSKYSRAYLDWTSGTLTSITVDYQAKG